MLCLQVELWGAIDCCKLPSHELMRTFIADASADCTLMTSLLIFSRKSIEEIRGTACCQSTANLVNRVCIWEANETCTCLTARVVQDLEESEAKAAFIWILGEFGNSIQACLVLTLQRTCSGSLGLSLHSIQLVFSASMLAAHNM